MFTTSNALDQLSDRAFEATERSGRSPTNEVEVVEHELRQRLLIAGVLVASIHPLIEPSLGIAWSKLYVWFSDHGSRLYPGATIGKKVARQPIGTGNQPRFVFLEREDNSN